MIPVSSGLPADHADEGFIVFAEDFQRLLVPLASFLLNRLPSGCLQTQPLGYFEHPCQLSAGPKVSLWCRLPALRAGEIRRGPLPAAGDACPAEVMTAVDGDGVSEILQADGAGGFAGELCGGARRSHGAPNVSCKTAAAFIFLQARERRFPSCHPQGGQSQRCAWVGREKAGDGQSPPGCIPQGDPRSQKSWYPRSIWVP